MSNKVFSKVILSGEHSVLRGGYAVVAPNKNHFLEYEFENSSVFSITLAPSIIHYELLFLGLIESALGMSGASKSDLKVTANVKSIVPLGEGLGGSAALCVFIARLLLFAGVLKEDDVFPFAHEIENVFHGQSSGLDVAGCMSDQIILYQKGVKKIKGIKPALSGVVFTIHQTGEKGETKDCIEKVLKLRKDNKLLFDSLDDQMSEASLKIKSGLEENDINKLISSFNDTHEIFKQWELVPETMEEKIKSLKSEGALCCRVTGSGMGGCIVSLWKRPPAHYNEQVFLTI